MCPGRPSSSGFVAGSTSARIADRAEQDERIGFCHIAVSTGSAEQVRDLTERLRQDGYAVLGEPRTTGDGYYESVVADPEGNRVEITI